MTLKEMLSTRSIPSDNEWFFQTFTEVGGKFSAQETENFDFKKTWPSSLSDEYFGGLLKLVTAFANTSGGLIIFGVDDATRSPVKSTIRPNIDKLSQSAKQYLTNPPAIAYREYSSPRIGKFDVLIVYPKNKGELPTKFAKTIGNAKVDSLWVRIGHETILAQAKHIPIIFFRSELESSGVGDSTVEHALPPSPSTIKRFVGRLSTIYKVFEWLHSQPPKAKIASYKLFSSEKSLPTNGVSFEVRVSSCFSLADMNITWSIHGGGRTPPRGQGSARLGRSMRPRHVIDLDRSATRMGGPGWRSLWPCRRRCCWPRAISVRHLGRHRQSRRAHVREVHTGKRRGHERCLGAHRARFRGGSARRNGSQR